MYYYFYQNPNVIHQNSIEQLFGIVIYNKIKLINPKTISFFGRGSETGRVMFSFPPIFDLKVFFVFLERGRSALAVSLYIFCLELEEPVSYQAKICFGFILH